ncbi:MAG TPA: metalloregulator ArsR/SmtB family transcription factor [Acidimicrobiales bacterium]|nr:metalloregulator ArsR/SmtB family transcription factor [Acidimicrobiales bacterium]
MNVDVEVDEATGALLKLLGEPLRWEIVRRLAVEDLCNCHLVEELGAPQPLVSHHLRALRQAGVVRAERFGSFTYYCLVGDVISGLAARLGALATAPAPRRRRPCS